MFAHRYRQSIPVYEVKSIGSKTFVPISALITISVVVRIPLLKFPLARLNLRRGIRTSNETITREKQRERMNEMGLEYLSGWRNLIFPQ